MTTVLIVVRPPIWRKGQCAEESGRRPSALSIRMLDNVIQAENLLLCGAACRVN